MVDDERRAWRSAALDLPRLHVAIEEGHAELAIEALSRLQHVNGPGPVRAPHDADPEHVLDVLMVEAFARRHLSTIGQGAYEPIAAAARRAADRLGMRPIISYPLYIRSNPMAPEALRRFTPLPAEARFIRMHRFIEDRFDELITRLESIVRAPDPGRAFEAQLPDIGGVFRRVNRVMAGFRDSSRMPNHDFVHGFRPYFDSVRDPDTGAVVLDGPSGLQSPTFRIIAMLTGYADPVLDDWTRRIAEYHDPETRAQLHNALAARDAGRTLAAALADRLPASFGELSGLPHMHADYEAHIPDLLRLARHGGYLSQDVEAVFDAHDIELGHWPAEPPDAPASPDGGRLPAIEDDVLCAAGPYVELEAMLFGFHVEHVAVAASQIGHERGTGGTSGVEFLLLALFRRAFPALWVSGVAGRIVDRALG